MKALLTLVGTFKPTKKYGNPGLKINTEGGVEESKSLERLNGKKWKQANKSSESCNTGSITDFEEDVIERDGDVLAKQNFG